MLLLSVRHAWNDARRDEVRVPLLGLLVCGLLLGLVQDAWTDPGTALPIFCVLGAVWADARRELDGPGWLAAPVIVMGIGLLLLAWPRLDAHMSYRSFFKRADADGRIMPSTYRLLKRAAETSPGDAALQAVLLDVAVNYYLPTVGNDDGIVLVEQDIAEASARLEQLQALPRAGEEVPRGDAETDALTDVDAAGDD